MVYERGVLGIPGHIVETVRDSELPHPETYTHLEPVMGEGGVPGDERAVELLGEMGARLNFAERLQIDVGINTEVLVAIGRKRCQQRPECQLEPPVGKLMSHRHHSLPRPPSIRRPPWFL